MRLEDYLIDRNDTMLLVIDIQEKLNRAIPHETAERVIKNTRILIETAALYAIPVVVTEQYRSGLGPTVDTLMNLINGDDILEKMHFNCMLDGNIHDKINSYNKRNVIVAGIEAHVCVFQTAMSLIAAGKNVIVISDAVASRRKHDWKAALGEMARAGAKIYPAETAAFILLEKAGTPEFKSLSPLFK